MKVRINVTVDVDAATIKRYLDDLGSDESVREFVASMIVCPSVLDESIESATGESHTTRIVKAKESKMSQKSQIYITVSEACHDDQTLGPYPSFDAAYQAGEEICEGVEDRRYYAHHEGEQID